MNEENNNREFFRHVVATIAYRGGKAIRNAPKHFADFKIGETTRTPIEILAHMGDLFDWSLSQINGEEKWKDSESLSWENEVERFFEAVKTFDDYLASDKPIKASLENVFQGPMADALTHIGQIAMLRRLAESPIKGENFFIANVEKGRVGKEQSKPNKEFD